MGEETNQTYTGNSPDKSAPRIAVDRLIDPLSHAERMAYNAEVFGGAPQVKADPTLQASLPHRESSRGAVRTALVFVA